MNFRSAAVLAMASLLFIGMASAVTVTSDEPSGSYTAGDSIIVTTDFVFNCVDEGTEDTAYKATIVNAGDYSWINASEVDITYLAAQCTSSPDSPGDVTMTVSEVAIAVDFTGVAPAFTNYTLQPGLVGLEENEGGSFDVQSKYVSEFTAPTALSFEAAEGGATAIIPLTSKANADSVFSFEVTSLTIDGEDASATALAEIQATLEVDLADDLSNGTATSVTLDFADEMPHDDMEMDANATGEDEDMDHTHSDWATAEVTVAIIQAAADDGNLTSDAKSVVLTFTNPGAGLDLENGTDEEFSDDEGFFTPGYELLAAIAALGAVAALRRRN